MDPSRRVFLASAASYRQILGANERIRLGCLGAGGRGQYLLNIAAKLGGTEVTAVCDVYAPRREQVRAKFGPQAREYGDHRELLEQKDVDAVVIGSPDHWHVPMTIDAVRAGKDVYVEKPVSHSIAEGEALVRATDSAKPIVQIGYQQRSWDHFMQAREVVQSGKLGKLTFIMTSWYQNYVQSTSRTPQFDTSKLDWKRFLGSAPDQPFRPERYAWWRWYWDFGGGHLTDLHSHYGDVVHWFMNVDRPLAAQAMGSRYALTLFECPDTISASWSYPDFQLTYTGTLSGSLDGGNLIFRGTAATMKLNRDGFAVYEEGKVPFERTYYPDPVLSAKSAGDGTVPHMRNFLDCVRSRKQPNCPVRAGVPAAAAAHLANLTLPGRTRKHD